MNIMNKLYTSIGLMSGTSADGIDASIIQSDGENELVLINDLFLPYDEKIRSDIKILKEKVNSSLNLITFKKDLINLEKKLTFLNAKAVELVLKTSKIKRENLDIIGYHGQTIYHSFKDKLSKQLGDGKLLSQLSQSNLVYNFRANDIKNGGQGAPLTPIYHKLIYKKFKIDKPVFFVNIGGISNLTFIDQDKLKSFDSGPGNCLIDKFIQIKSDNKIQFDINGDIASKGNVNEVILENYLSDPYYQISPPKSLDINDFNLSGIRGLSLEDSLATLSELTVRTIYDSTDFYQLKSKKIILCGGGRKNKYFFNRLSQLFNNIVIDIDTYNINGDFIESQAFAYLAIRNIINKPVSFKETTGTSKPTISGVLTNFK